jgi:hypothetical protein
MTTVVFAARQAFVYIAQGRARRLERGAQAWLTGIGLVRVDAPLPVRRLAGLVLGWVGLE